VGTFSLPVIALFALLGSLAGFLAGLLGIGGGIIFVPLFLWTFQLAGFAPEILVHTAFGTSLGIIILTAASSTFGHRKRGNVDWHHVVFLAIGGLVGAVAGAWLATLLTGPWLKTLFGIMQIMVAANLLFFRPRLPPERSGPVAPVALMAVGLAGGLFSAFFGVGGGVVAVPLMVIVLGFPMQLAVGNSSALIVVSSVAGTFSYLALGWNMPHLPPYSVGYVNFLVMLLVAPFTIGMARVGVRVAAHTSHDKLVKVFAIVLVVIGLRMVVRF
jgi:uncharacterized membrane protein YfcA